MSARRKTVNDNVHGNVIVKTVEAKFKAMQRNAFIIRKQIKSRET